MNPTDKHKLIHEIYFSMQATHSEKDMKQIFKEYGVVINLYKNYDTEELKQTLRQSDDNIVLAIAKDLKLSTSEYVKNRGTKKQAKSVELNETFISHAEKESNDKLNDLSNNIKSDDQGKVQLNNSKVEKSTIANKIKNLNINYD